MISVDMLESICKWLKTNVADTIKLKKPDNDYTDGSYTYTEVNPSVYPLYVPSSKEVTMPAPCMCVSPEKVEDDFIHESNVSINIALIVWALGIHSDGLWTPDGLGGYTRPLTHSENQSFTAYQESYLDIWNLTDITIRAIKKDMRIADMAVIPNINLTYGVAETGLYGTGYWSNYIKLTLLRSDTVARDYDNLL